MPRVKDVMQRLLVYGERQGILYSKCPNWPPDVFAVAATLVEHSACYARHSPGSGSRVKYLHEILDLANQWIDTGKCPPTVQNLWALLANTSNDVTDDSTSSVAWWDAALRLVAIADEASVDIGFCADPKEDTTSFGRMMRLAIRITDKASDKLRESKQKIQPHWPNSICRRIAPSEACVQPKARTPQVGCTLRSLSHHLALLPSYAQVSTEWHHSRASYYTRPPHFNLMLIPFPFSINAAAFQSAPAEGRTGTYFEVCQHWIDSIKAVDLAGFLVGLVKEAEKEGGEVHGIVLPELALSATLARSVALKIVSELKQLELFVTGICRPVGRKKHQPRFRNCAYACSFLGGKTEAEWYQGKHHRWCLTRSQIERYQLGSVLDAGTTWWEDIALSDVKGTRVLPRDMIFHIFRHGTVLTTLVCEDLARIEPVQNVLRSVGANLVICLLLDGAQLKERWPARYATVLAEDPGSSVVTLTSLGMIVRGDLKALTEPARIALWQEQGMSARELSLPPDCHGVLLSMTFPKVENFTLDGRTDNAMTVCVSQSGCRPVKHPNPPNWLDDPRRGHYSIIRS